MGWINVHPDFQNSSKNYFTLIPSDEGIGTKNPRSLGITAIFAIFRILKYSVYSLIQALVVWWIRFETMTS